MYVYLTEEEITKAMIQGNVDISFLTDEMLDNTKFAETTVTGHANGYWNEIHVVPPEYADGSDVIYQSFGNDCPQWVFKVAEQFDWMEHQQVTINKIMPGRFIPPHKDKMYNMRNYLEQENVDMMKKKLVRSTIFLQDHKIGHWLSIDNKSFDNYSKGDYGYIFPDQLHVVANLGHAPRYTMQITGLIN